MELLATHVVSVRPPLVHLYRRRCLIAQQRNLPNCPKRKKTALWAAAISSSERYLPPAPLELSSLAAGSIPGQYLEHGPL